MPTQTGLGLNDNWVYKTFVSPSSGLVINDLRYGPRRIADSFSLPYLRLTLDATNPSTSDENAKIGHLSPVPVPTDSDVQSTMVGAPVCGVGEHPGVSVTYRVTSQVAQATFLVQQAYRFDFYDSSDDCEASGTAKCVRFWPTVSWVLQSQGTNRYPHLALKLVQRFDLAPDGSATNSVNLMADVPSVAGGHLETVKQLDEHGSMMNEDALDLITDGEATNSTEKNGKLNPESMHLSGRPDLGLPGLPKNLPGPVFGGSGYAGCTDCVHVHWTWFANQTFRSVTPCQPGTQCPFSNGRPQLAPGSRQTACIGVVKADRPEDQGDWCERAKKPASWRPVGLDHLRDRVALYWQTEGQVAGAPTTALFNRAEQGPGETAWPQLPSKETGGNGSWFVVPARSFQTVSGTPATKGEASIQASAGRPVLLDPRFGSGWVVPVVLTVGGCDLDKGPYYLRVRTHGTLRLLNADTAYTPRDTGEPWVRLYDESVPTGKGGRTTAPPVLWSHQTCSPLTPPVGQPPRPGDPPRPGASQQPIPMIAFVVFDRQPNLADQVSYELDAAPDGIPFYGSEPATGRWPDAGYPNVDWRSLAFNAAGCISRAEFTAGSPHPLEAGRAWDAVGVSVHMHDVTGDGIDEVYVEVNCPSSTSSWPEQVVYFDASHQEAKVLGVLPQGQDAYLRGAKMTPVPGGIDLSGPAVGEHDPLCCADSYAHLVYKWTGSSFELTVNESGRTSQPIVHGGLADGQQYLLIQKIAGRQATVDAVEYFEGAEAIAACKEDGVAVDDSEYCNGYYYRNNNDLLRILPVSPTVRITYISDASRRPVPLPPDSLDTLTTMGLVGTDTASYWDTTVSDGAVVRMDQMFVS